MAAAQELADARRYARSGDRLPRKIWLCADDDAAHRKGREHLARRDDPSLRVQARSDFGGHRLSFLQAHDDLPGEDQDAHRPPARGRKSRHRAGVGDLSHARDQGEPRAPRGGAHRQGAAADFPAQGAALRPHLAQGAAARLPGMGRQEGVTGTRDRFCGVHARRHRTEPPDLEQPWSRGDVARHSR